MTSHQGKCPVAMTMCDMQRYNEMQEVNVASKGFCLSVISREKENYAKVLLLHENNKKWLRHTGCKSN